MKGPSFVIRISAPQYNRVAALAESMQRPMVDVVGMLMDYSLQRVKTRQRVQVVQELYFDGSADEEPKCEPK